MPGRPQRRRRKLKLHHIVFKLQQECAEAAVLAVAEELRGAEAETRKNVQEESQGLKISPGDLATTSTKTGPTGSANSEGTAPKISVTLASQNKVRPQEHQLIAPPLSSKRLEQFRKDLADLESAGPYMLSVRDFRAVLPALACAKHAPLPRLPQRARCILLRALRGLVEDSHLDGNRTTPGAYFEFPSSRMGVIQLAPIPGSTWKPLRAYTFTAWIWFPSKRAQPAYEPSAPNVQPQDALLFSLSTSQAIGTEARMREEQGEGRDWTFELRFLNPLQHPEHRQSCTRRVAIQSNCWHMISVTHFNTKATAYGEKIPESGESGGGNVIWYLDGEIIGFQDDQGSGGGGEHVPFPEVSAGSRSRSRGPSGISTNSMHGNLLNLEQDLPTGMSTCLVGGRFEGRIGGFGLFGGILSRDRLRLLFKNGPCHSLPPISVRGSLPRCPTTVDGEYTVEPRRTFRLPVIFWYDARHRVHVGKFSAISSSDSEDCEADSDNEDADEDNVVSGHPQKGAQNNEGDSKKFKVTHVSSTEMPDSQVAEWYSQGSPSQDVIMMSPVLATRFRGNRSKSRNTDMPSSPLAYPRKQRFSMSSHTKQRGPDERTARLAGGVRPVQSRSGQAQRALFIAGGCQLFLPLFAQLETPPETSLPARNSAMVEHEGDTGTPDTDYDEALELVMLLLQMSVGEFGGTLLSEMHYLIGAIPTISALLHSSPDPRILSTGFLGAVMLLVRDLMPLHVEMAQEVLREILLDLSLWSRASFEVQDQLVHLLFGLDAEFTGILAKSCGVQRLLDMTQIAYCRVASDCHPNVQSHLDDAAKVAINAVNLARRMFHVETEASVDERATGAMFKEVNGDNSDFQREMEKEKEHKQIFLSELNAVLCFVRCCSGSIPGKAAACAALNLLNELLDDSYSSVATYNGLQRLGGAAEVLPLVSRPGANARVAAIGLLGRCLAESRRIVRLYVAQQEERRKRSNSLNKIRRDGNAAASNESRATKRSLDVFSSSPQPPSSPNAPSSALRRDFRQEQPSSSVASATAAAAAALYGTSPSAISEARASLIEASQLPSEAKSKHMYRLMSATLIELTSKDTLAMVTCADGVWDDWQVQKSADIEQANPPKSHSRLASVSEEESNRLAQQAKGSNETNNMNASVSDSCETIWPEAAYGRFVSEATVDAVMRLIIGDWGSLQKQNESDKGSIYSGGAADVSIVIPEGLLLLFGLISTRSIRPSVRCRCLTQVGMWIKGSSENARAVLNCPNWQRWFVGMHSASMRLFNYRRTNGIMSSSETEGKGEYVMSKKDAFKRSPASSMDVQLSADDTAMNEDTLALRPAMTMLIIDCLSSLYSYLLTDVRRGFAHWGVFIAHSLKIPGGLYFTRAVVIAVLERVMSLLKREPFPSGSEELSRARSRSNTSIGLISMPNHIADNLGATFQLVDEMLVSGSIRHTSAIQHGELSNNGMVFASSPHHPSQESDNFDDSITAKALFSIPDYSNLNCNGSDLLNAVLATATHMRRCGVMHIRSESKYPSDTAKLYHPSSSSSSLSSNKGIKRSQCLSWRVLPVLRLVLRMMRSTGTTRDSVREQCLNFLQGIVSSELHFDPISNGGGKETTSRIAIRREHTRLVLLSIISSLGIVCTAECKDAHVLSNEASRFASSSEPSSQSVPISSRMRELHAAMLIAVANNHELSPEDQMSDFYSESMRPQTGEGPLATASRILAIMKKENRNFSFAEHSSTTSAIKLKMSKSTASCLSSPSPPLFAQATDAALSENVRRSMRRSLAHSFADVAELSNRQSARSSLDRQRLASSVSQYQDRLRRIRSWYEEYTWPTLLSAIHGMWDYSQLHAKHRYVKRYWSLVGVATESDRTRRLSSSVKFESNAEAIVTSKLDTRKSRHSKTMGPLLLSSRMRRESFGSRAIVGIAGAKDMPTPIFDLRRFSRQRILSLHAKEEHLFSRRRRLLGSVPINREVKYEKLSYYSFAHHRSEDERAAARRRQAQTHTKKEQKLSDSHLQQLASGIANAIDMASVNGKEDIQISTPASLAGRSSLEGGSKTSTNGDTDGWEAEDDAWDQAAKESEARAAAFSMSSENRSDKHDNSESRNSSILRKVHIPATRRSQVVQMATVAPPADSDTIIHRDPDCASVCCDAPEPIPGALVMTASEISFQPKMTESDGTSRDLYLKRHQRWPISQIRRVFLRSYCLVDNSFELILTGGRSAFFHMLVGDAVDSSEATTAGKKKKSSKERRDAFVSDLFKFLPRKVRSWSQNIGTSSRAYFESLSITRAWQDRAISNFDYLMALNTISGRTYNDLSQYPVFPWILTDYTSDDLDLSDPSVYRDLRKPVGALNASRLKEFRERYETFDDPIIPKFLYGSHYSTAAGVVLYFLLRSEPFTSLHIDTQDGHFDVPDRLFSSIEQVWSMCFNSLSEVKELTPEFYYFPDFLRNRNDLPLGKTQEGQPVGDVVLPPWASGSATRFVNIMRAALESEHVSQSLHRWIDLIFGYKQRGLEAVKAHNVFYYLTYEGAVHLEQIKDPALRKATELQIAHFGQCPRRLLRTPHPVRGSRIQIPRSLILSLSADFIERVRPRHRWKGRSVHIPSLSEDDEETLQSENTPSGTIYSGNTVVAFRKGKRTGLSMAHLEISSKAPGLDSIVQMGFSSHRGLDALDAASHVVEIDDEPMHLDDSQNRATDNQIGHDSSDPGERDNKESQKQKEEAHDIFSGVTPSPTGLRSSSGQSPDYVSRRSNSLKLFWRTHSDPRSKEAVMALAMQGDAMRISKFSKTNAVVHTAIMTASSRSLSSEQNETALSDAPLIAVRALHDRIHAISSRGVVCSFLVQRNTAPSFLNTQTGDQSPSSDRSSMKGFHDQALSRAGALSDSEIHAAARASAAFVPLSVRCVSPSSSDPSLEQLCVPVCWSRDVSPGIPLYKPAVCWSSAGSVLACANGVTGSVSLWGVSRNNKGASGSVVISDEAAVSGGHWSTVTSCCISADSLLTCDTEGVCLIWFLCRLPGSRRAAVSARPYFMLRGHSSPVILCALSHSLGITVTASENNPREVLIHQFQRPPPNESAFEPGHEFPIKSIDISGYKPFVSSQDEQSSSVVIGASKNYVITLVTICTSGEIIVHAQNLHYAVSVHDNTKVSEDLTSLKFRAGTSQIPDGKSSSGAQVEMPAFVLCSFDVNGNLNSWTSSSDLNNSSEKFLVDHSLSGSNSSEYLQSPLQALECSRKSPIVVGGSRNGKVFFWHSLDLELLGIYDIGASFAIHSISLNPSDEWIAVGASTGILATIAMPNCRDGSDPTLDRNESLAEGVRKRVAGTVGKAATVVSSLSKSVSKRFFGWMGKGN